MGRFLKMMKRLLVKIGKFLWFQQGRLAGIVVVLMLLYVLVSHFPSSIVLVPAFFVAFFSFIIGNYAWKELTSPLLEIRKGERFQNVSQNADFHRVFIKNVGRSSCNNAMMKVYLRPTEDGKPLQCGEPVDFSPKWTAAPEPVLRYFYERVPGTTGNNTQIMPNSEGIAPSVMANTSQMIQIPPMPKKDKNFIGEEATVFCFDRGAQFRVKLEGEETPILWSIPAGLKKFSAFDFYLTRVLRKSVLGSHNYEGELYVVGDDYCGVCKIKVKKWQMIDDTITEAADIICASDSFDFTLSCLRMRGVKSLSVVNNDTCMSSDRYCIARRIWHSIIVTCRFH